MSPKTPEEQKLQEMAARQEILNAYSNAVDGLTCALSWARTSEPPSELPGNYLSVEEFIERAKKLLEIAQNWETTR